VTYYVGYAVCPLYDQSKGHKAGSTAPIKLQLCDVNGDNASAAGTRVHATDLVKVDNGASASVDPTSAANPDNDFRYDAAPGGYVYNLKTTGLTTGTWQLNFIITGDGVTHSVRFDIRQDRSRRGVGGSAATHPLFACSAQTPDSEGPSVDPSS
jgi:hypothetical protein